VPNTTAGLLIGKAGAYIKQIKDESGAFVQISPKQTDLPERVVSIEGDSENRKKALHMCLNKIAEDPHHSSVPNLSYSNIFNSDLLTPSLNNQINGQNGKFDFNSAGTYLGF
jgi:RNA-binding protein Nova